MIRSGMFLTMIALVFSYPGYMVAQGKSAIQANDVCVLRVEKPNARAKKAMLLHSRSDSPRTEPVVEVAGQPDEVVNYIQELDRLVSEARRATGRPDSHSGVQGDLSQATSSPGRVQDVHEVTDGMTRLPSYKLPANFRVHLRY